VLSDVSQSLLPRRNPPLFIQGHDDSVDEALCMCRNGTSPDLEAIPGGL
jgi:hypothetical protein